MPGSSQGGDGTRAPVCGFLRTSTAARLYCVLGGAVMLMGVLITADAFRRTGSRHPIFIAGPLLLGIAILCFFKALINRMRELQSQNEMSGCENNFRSDENILIDENEDINSTTTNEVVPRMVQLIRLPHGRYATLCTLVTEGSPLESSRPPQPCLHPPPYSSLEAARVTLPPPYTSLSQLKDEGNGKDEGNIVVASSGDLPRAQNTVENTENSDQGSSVDCPLEPSRDSRDPPPPYSANEEHDTLPHPRGIIGGSNVTDSAERIVIVPSIPRRSMRVMSLIHAGPPQ